MTETILVSNLVAGSSEAFDSLFKLYNKKIYQFALSFLKQEDDAKDIVQEVFIKLWQNRDSIKDLSSFKSYLFTIAYNSISDQFRKRFKDQSFRIRFESMIPKESPPEHSELEYKELQDQYIQAVSELPPNRKKIYEMHKDLGMTYKEIARKLNISPNTVRNQYAQAMKSIRGRIKGHLLTVLLFIALFV